MKLFWVVMVTLYPMTLVYLYFFFGSKYPRLTLSEEYDIILGRAVLHMLFYVIIYLIFNQNDSTFIFFKPICIFLGIGAQSLFDQQMSVVFVLFSILLIVCLVFIDPCDIETKAVIDFFLFLEFLFLIFVLILLCIT